MRRVPRWLIFTTIVVLVALGALTSVVVGTVRRPFPQLSGEVALPGLSAPVEVLRDEYGVPHIYADNAEDLFEAQGFVHAQDRFFEMDLRRHITAGRLSELFGSSQVETDAYVRTLGWRRVAEQELGLLSATTRRYLDAYASGVNTYLRGRSPADLSLEYSLLSLRGIRDRPADWTAVDSLSWLKAMAWDLGSNLDDEIERARMAVRVGAQRAAELRPDYPIHEFDPIVTGGSVRDESFDPDASPGSSRPAPATPKAPDLRSADLALGHASRISSAIPALLGNSRLGESGSNAWALAGSLTQTGKPILANDPHLATSIPSIFTQVGLHCRRPSSSCPFDVSGFSFAGLPGVVIGKNASIAWGMTTSYADVQDLYLEQVRGNTARDGNSYVPLQVRTEDIAVAGEPEPRTITVRSSRHGPLLSDVDPQLTEVGAAPRDSAAGPFAVALAWTALTPNRSMDALLRINAATTFAEFRAAAKLLGAPSQNLVYADTAGNIGYQLPGAIPVREEGDGLRPSPGWDRRYDWRGLIPFEQLPFLYNPPSGYIVTANNQVISDRYPFRIGSEFSYGWRSQEIIDTIKRSPRQSVADAARLQSDDTVRFAADLVPTLLRVKISDPWVVEGQRTLVGWDYNSSAESAAAAYFFAVFSSILKRTFRDEMPTDLWPRSGDRWYAVISALIQDPNNPWWDDTNTAGVVEKRDDIMVAALTDARKELTTRMSRETSGWAWGRMHRLGLRNSSFGSSGIGVVERLFNRGDYAAGGAGGVINAMAYDDQIDYRVRSGAAMRMTIDMADPDRSVWVNQSGVSGHPYAGHYDDQTKLWATHQTWPFVSTLGAVEAGTRNRLTLTPGG
jgi:penicillin G amidase